MTSLRRGSAIAECLLVALVTFVSPVFGQVPPPEAIHSPIRREWRGPIEKFLSEMTNQDPTHLVEKIVGFQIGAIWHPQLNSFPCRGWEHLRRRCVLHSNRAHHQRQIRCRCDVSGWQELHARGPLPGKGLLRPPK